MYKRHRQDFFVLVPRASIHLFEHLVSIPNLVDCDEGGFAEGSETI